MMTSRTAFARTAGRFRRDTRGTMAMLFATTMTVVALAVGGAVDYGLAMKVQSRMNGAVDAASLAAAKLLSSGVTDRTRLAAEAQKSFDANFADETAHGNAAAPLAVTADDASGLVKVTTTAAVGTNFLKLVGMDAITVRSTSSSAIDGDTVEVALMFDTTGSMADRTTDGKVKMTVAKAAAADLVDTLFAAASGGDDRIRIGLAPFAAGVNAGAYASTVSGGASAACVRERVDASYNASDVSGRAKPFRPAASCPRVAVVPLTADAATVETAIAGLGTGGTTAGHLGTLWAEALLSPDWADVFPSGRAGRAYAATANRKIAILMTDGLYNTFDGVSRGSAAATASADAALAACGAMKAKGVTVYTIGFDLGTQAAAKTLLTACASTVDGKAAFYDAEDAAALTAAFADITASILRIRLSS